MRVTFIQEDGTPRTEDIKAAENIDGMIVMTLTDGAKVARPRGCIIKVEDSE